MLLRGLCSRIIVAFVVSTMDELSMEIPDPNGFAATGKISRLSVMRRSKPALMAVVLNHRW